MTELSRRSAQDQWNVNPEKHEDMRALVHRSLQNTI